MIGIIVDEVKEVVTLTSEQVQKIAYDPKDETTNYINGVGKFDGELISLLDFNLVMQEKESI
jgi:purine-binding chemotaxis protein CheW